MRITEQVKTEIGKDGASVDSHPAFGAISLSKVDTGGAFQLYGCQSNVHSRCIRIEIKKSERRHNTGRDYFVSRGNPVVVAYLSLAQFSELITSVGQGNGTPCTFRYVEGQGVPEIPIEDDNEIGRITKRLSKNVRDKIMDKSSVDEIYSKLNEILDKKPMAKATRQDIFSLFENVIGLVRAKIPDAMDAFSESAERVAEEVRKDVVGLAADLGLNAGAIKLLEVGK